MPGAEQHSGFILNALHSLKGLRVKKGTKVNGTFNRQRGELRTFIYINGAERAVKLRNWTGARIVRPEDRSLWGVVKGLSANKTHFNRSEDTRCMDKVHACILHLRVFFATVTGTM